jgi:hypothetical protein
LKFGKRTKLETHNFFLAAILLIIFLVPKVWIVHTQNYQITFLSKGFDRREKFLGIASFLKLNNASVFDRVCVCHDAFIITSNAANGTIIIDNWNDKSTTCRCPLMNILPRN